jgi:hypothetical protein
MMELMTDPRALTSLTLGFPPAETAVPCSTVPLSGTIELEGPLMMKLRLARAGRSLRALVTAALTIVLSSTSVLGQGPNRTATKFYPDFSDTADSILVKAA